MITRVERSRPGLVWLPALVLVATVAQLAVATFVPGIERFADKAFGARLAAYPVMMLVVPAIWWLTVKRRRPDAAPPYVAFALVMLGFLVDTTGNSFDLYDSVTWWDDMNHFVNWFFLLSGIGLIIARHLEPRWAQVLLVTGLGCLLALGWELGEWYTFIRHGTELDTAYEDTLGDLTLGSSGAFLAALLVARVSSRQS
jgi:drug/metabolite transporter superfamily protein YnfA